MPDGVSVQVMGWDGFTQRLIELGVAVEKVTPVATKAAGEIVLTKVRNHMDGPLPPKPGGSPPARITGNLIGSLRNDPYTSGLSTWGRKIYPDGGQAPYARRIELGFNGTDSIGRKYNQPPYPYFTPGLEEALASGEIGKVFAESWGFALGV